MDLSRQQGLSVTEVLVGAVILGLSILAISPMLGWGIKTTFTNKERGGAVQAARRLIEDIQNAGFTGASSIVNPVTPTAVQTDDLQGNKLYVKGDGKVTTTPESGAKLLQVQRLYHFVPNDPPPADDLIQVTVKVTWPGSGSKNVTMGISLTREGIQ